MARQGADQGMSFEAANGHGISKFQVQSSKKKGPRALNLSERPYPVLQLSKLFASCDQVENSPPRRPSASLRTGSRLRERDFEIKNLCELCGLCGESLFSDLVAAVPRYE
jgi:hypothetical protein